ncbi:MAG: hypothetical protein MUC48_20710 [Leptolyngbya sp. Prado105]|nr:hypothetical protein [Leptolyngbya sp. Prado105]
MSREAEEVRIGAIAGIYETLRVAAGRISKPSCFDDSIEYHSASRLTTELTIAMLYDRVGSL